MYAPQREHQVALRAVRIGDRARLARHVRVAALRAVPPNALAFSVYVATMDLVG